MAKAGNTPDPKSGGFCLGLIALILLLAVVARCGGDEETSSPEPSDRQRTLEELQEKYPRIPANGIRIPSRSDLKNPDFDVGGWCLAEEKAGRGTFEDCMEVVGRELVAIGGPDER